MTIHLLKYIHCVFSCSQRFQKTYEALEEEGLAEKKQLQALHQQRVQSDLNDKKRHAMEHYMDALTTPDADVSVAESVALSDPFLLVY